MGGPPLVFEQCVFAFVPSESLSPKLIGQLSDAIKKHGGNFCGPLDDADLATYHATHIISETVDFPQYVNAQAFMIPVVSHHWVQAALSRGKLPQVRPYSPDPRLIFSNVVLTCIGLPDIDTESIVGATMALGGTESRSITRLTTHICTLELTDELQAHASAKGFRGVFVIPHWFNDCFRLGKRIGESPYTLPNIEVFTVNPNDGIKIPSSKSIVGAIDPNPTFPPRPDLESSREPLHVFQNKAVMLSSDLGITDTLRKTLADLVKHSGGSMVEKPDDCDLFVCKYRDGDDFVRASHLCKHVGNLAWFYHLIVNDTWTSPLFRLLHYPIPREPLKGFQDLRITVSNYGGEARTYLENLITAAGATFTKTMRNDNTHLVTARKTGDKCEAAADWGIEIINHLWVEESYAKCAAQPCSNPRYSHFPPRTNLSEVLGHTFFDESVLREKYYPGGEDLPKAAQLKRRIRDVANENVIKKGPAKGTVNFKDDGLKSPTTTNSARKAREADRSAMDLDTPVRQVRGRASTTTTPTAPSFDTSMTEMDIDTPVTTGRSAKSKAAQNIQNLVEDIKLYEKEMKRSSNGVWGGKRAADELEKAMQDALKGKRPEKERSVDGDDEESDEAHPSKKRRALPEIQYRIMVTGYKRWSHNAKLEEREKSRLREFGIKLVDDGSPCQYLAAPKVLRTLKFLKTLARGPTLINTLFIDSVLDQDTMLDPANFLLSDPEYEAANDMDLQEAVARARANKGRLLAGVPIFCTDHVVNGKDTYRSIAEANGALWREWTGRNVIKPSKGDTQTVGGALEPVYLLSSHSVKEQRLYGRFIEMAINGNMEPRIVVTDWLLSMAIKQEYFWDEKYLAENWHGTSKK